MVHMGCHYQILVVKWQDHVKNVDTADMTSLPDIADIMRNRSQALFGHVVILEAITLAHHALKQVIATKAGQHPGMNWWKLLDGNGTPASGRQMWQSAEEQGHDRGESSQWTTAMPWRWWWWWCFDHRLRYCANCLLHYWLKFNGFDSSLKVLNGRKFCHYLIFLPIFTCLYFSKTFLFLSLVWLTKLMILKLVVVIFSFLWHPWNRTVKYWAFKTFSVILWLVCNMESPTDIYFGSWVLSFDFLSLS